MEKQKLKERKSKTQKGITLVALIITIIVLLILAIVTIRAVQGDGIIQHAKNASKETTVAQEKEQIQLAVNEWKIQKNYQNGPGNFKSFMSEKISNVDSVDGSDAGPLTVKMKGTGNIYTVKEDGTITGPKEIGNLSDLEKYILGENGEGRDLSEILNLSSMIFLQDPDDSTSTMHNKVKFASEPEDTYDLYIRYNRNVYKFSISAEEDKDGNYVLKTAKDSLTLINTPAGNLGKYVTYKNIPWIVLRDDENGVELISANATGSVTLGGEKFDDARKSYNNAITTLTEACKAATGITENIRNVGGPASDTTTTTVDFSELTTFEQSVDDTNFAKYEGETNGLKVGDEKYRSDYEQMENLGILATDTPANYCLASRFVDENSSYVGFKIRSVDYYGEFNNYNLCRVDSDGSHIIGGSTCTVRPVVSLSSGILDSVTQSGTIDDPIILQ